MNYYYHEGKNLLLNRSEIRQYFGVPLNQLNENQLKDSGFVIAEDPYRLNADYQAASIFSYVTDGRVIRKLNPAAPKAQQAVFLEIQNKERSVFRNPK